MLKRALDYLNPAYHLRRMKEDLNLMHQALRTRKTLAAPKNEEELQQLFRGRLFAAFFLSGPFGMVGAALGYAVQRWTENPWIGWIGTIFFTMTVTTAAYQLMWFLNNRDMYGGSGSKSTFAELQRDLWPVHWFGIRTGFLFALMASPINAILIGALQLFSASMARTLPIPVLVLLVDWIVVQGTFVRLMGDFFDRHSRVLAARRFNAPTVAN